MKKRFGNQPEPSSSSPDVCDDLRCGVSFLKKELTPLFVSKGCFFGGGGGEKKKFKFEFKFEFKFQVPNLKLALKLKLKLFPQP